MYSVLNKLSKYTYFYISKKITSYIFLLAFKIVESLQCILMIDMTVIRGSYPCNNEVRSKIIFYNLALF